MCSTWRNPDGEVSKAGSKGPSTSCVTRISLMEVCSFFVPSGSVIACSEVILTQVKKRVLSAAARAKISKATKASWVKFRAENSRKRKT